MILFIYCFLFIVLIVALIVLIISKRKVRKSETHVTGSSKQSNIKDSSVLNLLPHHHYDMEHDCIVFKDGTYRDLIQIKTQDLRSASYDEILYAELKFSRFYKKYADDLKIIATNFPADTHEQQDYVKHKISETKNKIHKKWLKKRLRELKWLEKHRTKREFFFMIFGKDVEDIIRKRDMIAETLGTDKNGFAILINYEKKEAILKKLNNKALSVMGRGDKD